MPGQSQTILVVDDDPSARDLVKAQMPVSYRLLEAGTAAEALALLAREAVDLVLLDVVLPDMSGYEACLRVKSAAGGGAFLPVLLLTVLGAQADRNAGLAAGADDYLVKTSDPEELRLRVKVFLRLREQDRLIRAQVERLREADALKDELAALVVHDLRNPLTSVVSVLAALRAQAPPALQEDVEDAWTAASRIRHLVEDLLAVRDIEERGARLAPRRVALNDVLLAAADALQGYAQSSRIALAVQAPEVLAAFVDAPLVQRAVENLVSNAIRHAPAGSEVTLSVEREGDALALRVADRGPGIPADQRAGVFEKYGALAGGPDARRGHGLGLYLVALVARAHGGEARVDPRPGGGATFTLTLPRGGGADA